MLTDLQPGASATEISTLASTLTLPLPDNVVQSLRRHNGQAGRTPGVFGNWDLLSTTGIAQQWTAWNDLHRAGTFSNWRADGSPGIQRTWFHPHWIPLPYDGAGSHHAADLAPDSGGVSGQVIVFGRHTEFRKILAGSFSAWLAHIAGQLERGVFALSEHPNGREFYDSGFLP